MSIVYTHALNYSQLESSLVDTASIGFMSEETFTNDNQQYYSPSTSSEMETMFTNSEYFPVKQEENDPFSQGIQYNGYSYYESPNQMIFQTHQQNHKLNNDFVASFSAVNLLSRQSSCSINMPQIVENHEHEARKNIGISYMPSFTSDSWDTSIFNAPTTSTMNGQIMFSTSNAWENQDLDFGYQKLGLSHHLSLPSSSTKMTIMDKFYHIQGSVPCKIRAKRGFATHPRSIAERERRIRISARIKKLQDLFPNSDRQTSTADMLDVAVDYIKDLRKQLKILSDTKAKCSCTSN